MKQASLIFVLPTTKSKIFMYYPFFKIKNKSVFFLQYHVLPVDEKYEKAKGAYVNCWICFKATDYICDLAVFYIEKTGWKVKKLLNPPQLVTKKNFIQDRFGLYCYKESLKKGYSLSFYPWLLNQSQPIDVDEFIYNRNKKYHNCLRQRNNVYEE